MRPYATSVCGRTLHCMRPYATSVCGLKLLVYEALSYLGNEKALEFVERLRADARRTVVRQREHVSYR